MFEREPKVKPVHIQETSFLKINDLVQQDKDNQSNSHVMLFKCYSKN